MPNHKLSLLQKSYKEFFLAMLADHNVDSPAKLTKAQKSAFFTRIKNEWPIKKAELLKSQTVTKSKPRTKKENYASLKVFKPSIAITPRAKEEVKKQINRNYASERNVIITKKIVSKKNPLQKDDLRINFYPNQFFEQQTPYQYPVVKMPKANAFLKLPRKGRAMGKGFKEQVFYEAIVAGVDNAEVGIDVHLSIPYFNRPYEPDIVVFDTSLNLYIDIEIDEPYDGYYRHPTHEFVEDEKLGVVKKDDTRDLFFIESGWVVIKFTERQVHQQEQQCIALINDVLNSLRNYELQQNSSCIQELQWSYQQAVKWQKNNYREKYLGIEQFGKQPVGVCIDVDIDDVDTVEANIDRTKIYDTPAIDENIAFEEEAHKYHHKKDVTGNAEYISVTTIINRFFPFDMDRFIQNKAKREERTEEDVLNEFLKNRDEASDKGTDMHLQIENFLIGEPYDANSKEFKMFLEFYEKIIVAKGFEFVEAEKKILLEEYNIAGMIDALFKKPNKDEYLILDWKRSKKLVVDGYPKKYGYGSATSELSHIDNSSYYKYALQQNMYKYILEVEKNMPVSSMNLIVLHENYDTFHRVNLVNMDKEIAIILNSINHKI